MIPSLVALIQEAGLSEDAKRQAAHALAMLAAEDWPLSANENCANLVVHGFNRTLNLRSCCRTVHAMPCGKRKLDHL